MATLISQSLSENGFTDELLLEPGKSADYAGSTADLEFATVVLEQSDDFAIWTPAYDIDGASVSDLVDDDGGTVAVSATLKNETRGPLYFRARFIETGGEDPAVGSVAVTFSSRADAAAIEDVVTVTDEGASFNVPVMLPDGSYVSTELSPGVGITNGTGTVFASSVAREGGLIVTRIYIDLTGLNGGGTINDIIGVNGAGVAYLGQITDAINGAIVAGRVTCLEVPTTGDPDIDLWSANEATGVEDTLITALTGEVQLTDGGDFTLADMIALIAVPVSGQYLYLTNGTVTAATYDAGKLLIELFGVPTE